MGVTIVLKATRKLVTPSMPVGEQELPVLAGMTFDDVSIQRNHEFIKMDGRMIKNLTLGKK